VRHRKKRSKMRGSVTERRAMFNNMISSLLEHGRITTTERRARELRGATEKIVTRAKSLGDLLLKDRTKLDAEDRARIIHAMRMVRRTIKDQRAVVRLFDEIAPRYLGRPGGYLRINKIGARKGDAAPMAIIEFIEAEMPEKEGAPQTDDQKKGRFSWLRRKKGAK